MKRDNWEVRDCDISPAGSPNHCFYCKESKSSTHKLECVIRKKSVVVEVKIQLLQLVPEHWTAQDIEFHANNSSWCASNIIQELDKQSERRGCLCDDFELKYIREATEEDEKYYCLSVKDSKS